MFGGPVGVAQPGALVATFAGDADHVARGTLHAVGRRKNAGQVGIDGIVGGKVEAEPGMALIDAEHAMKPETAATLAGVRAPDRRNAPAGQMDGGGEAAQVLAARRSTAPDRRTDAWLWREFDRGVVAEEHDQLSMRAASWNQRVR